MRHVNKINGWWFLFLVATITILIIFLSHKNQNTKKIEIKNDAIVGQNQLILKKDQSYMLSFSADQEYQIHIEGYHAFGTVKPGTILQMKLEALTPGIFPIKLETENIIIGELVIN